MANWAADILEQSEFSILPIRGRKKNGIIFQRPSGPYVAVLAIQPCHYLDGANQWQSIDTTLLDAGGGKLGAPGLTPRILPTGEVQFQGIRHRHKTDGVGVFSTANNQYTELLSIPGGSVQDDKIIREVGDYRHETILKERGIKEQIILQSKPINLSRDYFVLSTEVFEGNLPKGVAESIQTEDLWLAGGTAWDAEHNIIPVTMHVVELPGPRVMVYSGVPVQWLENAVYPVTIDPTYDSQPGSEGYDTYITVDGPTTNYGSSTVVYIGDHPSGGAYRLLIKFDLSSIPSSADVTSSIGDHPSGGAYRLLIKFDLSSIPSSADVTSSYHQLTINTDIAANAANHRSYRQGRAWVEGQATWNIFSTGNNWSSAGGFSNSDLLDTTSDYFHDTTIGAADSGTKTFTHSVDPYIQGWVDGSDANNGWIQKTLTENNDLYAWNSSDHATAGNRPRMVIEYETVPSPSILGSVLTLFTPSVGLYDTRYKLRAKNRDTALTTKVR
jgi:hypothetical protein